MMMREGNELWKDILEYEGLYQVSSQGRVRSVSRWNVDRLGRKRFLRGKVLSPSRMHNGYFALVFKKNGKSALKLVHRLVAEAFIDNPIDKPQVNHINEIKSDNRVENLNWVTGKENVNYGTCIKRRAKKKNKPVLQYALNGGFIKRWDSARCAESHLKIWNQDISKCCNGKRKSAGGFNWRFEKGILK